MIKEITILVFLFGIGLTGPAIIYIKSQLAFAHSFEPNDSATFLTLANRAQVELLLANANFPLNVTLAMDHAKDGVRLINDAYRMDDDIVDDADFARKYNEALNTRSSTMHGLVIANIADQVLREYGEAFDVDYDLTNMSNMMMEVPSGMPSFSSPSDSADYATINDNLTIQNINSELVNFDDFQSAQELSEEASRIFRSTLLSPSLLLNNTEASVITRLDKNMADVNLQIHPDLQLMYGLKLKQ